jgi:hypothetical protein
MPVRVALVTVSTPLPVMLPENAFIVAVPATTPLASPLAAMVATAGLLLDHVTVAAQFELVLFE